MPKFVPAKKKAAPAPVPQKVKFRPAAKPAQPEPSSEDLFKRAVTALVSWEQTERRIQEARARRGGEGLLSKDRRQQLADRQADARSVGWPEPVALTEWGESVYGYTPDGRPITTCQKGQQTAAPVSAAPSPARQPIEKAAPSPVLSVAPKKPGVVLKIVETLRSASKKKPATKESILAVLVKAFPERDPKAMIKTVSSQVNGAMKAEKGIDVSTDGAGGYWISK